MAKKLLKAEEIRDKDYLRIKVACGAGFTPAEGVSPEPEKTTLSRVRTVGVSVSRAVRKQLYPGHRDLRACHDKLHLS